MNKSVPHVIKRKVKISSKISVLVRRFFCRKHHLKSSEQKPKAKMVLEVIASAVLTLTETYFVLESFNPTRRKQF